MIRYALPVFMVGLLLTLPVGSIAYGAKALPLEKRLLQEQERAVQRKTGLKWLTEQERKLNTDLAETERQILATEAALSELQKKLEQLARNDKTAEEEYEEIKKQQSETLQAYNELLLFLWELTSKKESIGGREMLDWAVTDREYRWSKHLLQALEGYHVLLADQEQKIHVVITRRISYAKDIQDSFKKIGIDKEKLLQLRLSYSQQLSKVRQERKNTEEELTEILKLVENLNLAIEKAGGDIARQQGKLPWPASGAIKKKYAPGATPAFRGIGISTPEKQPVVAVASGKVVHNNVLRGLGTVLILQHGSDYYSVYAYLADSPLKIGQEVTKLAQIGRAGFFPDINGSGVYFELRFRQKAINPEQWLIGK